MKLTIEQQRSYIEACWRAVKNDDGCNIYWDVQSKSFSACRVNPRESESDVTVTFNVRMSDFCNLPADEQPQTLEKFQTYFDYYDWSEIEESIEREQ